MWRISEVDFHVVWNNKIARKTHSFQIKSNAHFYEHWWAGAEKSIVIATGHFVTGSKQAETVIGI